MVFIDYCWVCKSEGGAHFLVRLFCALLILVGGEKKKISKVLQQRIWETFLDLFVKCCIHFFQQIRSQNLIFSLFPKLVAKLSIVSIFTPFSSHLIIDTWHKHKRRDLRLRSGSREVLIVRMARWIYLTRLSQQVDEGGQGRPTKTHCERKKMGVHAIRAFNDSQSCFFFLWFQEKSR